MTHAPNDRLDPPLRRLIGVLLLGGIMGLLDATIVNVGIDTLATQFDRPLSTVGWVATGYLLAVTVAIPLSAWAVDRFGAKRMWMFGLGLFLLGSLASGIAWSVESLIAFRVMQGLGGGTLEPIMLTLLARAAGPRRSGRVMGVMGVVLSMGPVLGPVLGGVILQGADWRWMFLVNLPVGGAAMLMSMRVVRADPEQAERPAARLDIVGLALLAPGFAVALLSLSQAADHAQFTAAQLLPPLVVAGLLLVGYVVHALRVRRTSPLIDLRLFTSRSFSASVITMSLVGMATFSMLFTLPLYYQQLHGLGVLETGMLVAPLGVGAAIAMPVAGRLSDRLAARRLASAGAAVAALSALALTRVGIETSSAWPLLGAFTVGAGLGFVGAPTMGSLYRTLPAPSVPQGSSTLFMFNQLGASTGIAVVAFLVQTAGDDGSGIAVQRFQNAFWWVAGIAVVILVLSSLLPGRSESADAAGPAEVVVK